MNIYRGRFVMDNKTNDEQLKHILELIENFINKRGS